MGQTAGLRTTLEIESGNSIASQETSNWIPLANTGEPQRSWLLVMNTWCFSLSCPFFCISLNFMTTFKCARITSTQHAHTRCCGPLCHKQTIHAFNIYIYIYTYKYIYIHIHILDMSDVFSSKNVTYKNSTSTQDMFLEDAGGNRYSSVLDYIIEPYSGLWLRCGTRNLPASAPQFYSREVFMPATPCKLQARCDQQLWAKCRRPCRVVWMVLFHIHWQEL